MLAGDRDAPAVGFEPALIAPETVHKTESIGRVPSQFAADGTSQKATASSMRYELLSKHTEETPPDAGWFT